MKMWINRLIQSFGYALSGIMQLIKEEYNARIHFLATIVVVIAGMYFPLSPYEWIALIFSIGLVWILEAVNTALENTLDFISTEQHPTIGKIKDIAAGAVLISAIVAVLIAIIIFYPKMSTGMI